MPLGGPAKCVMLRMRSIPKFAELFLTYSMLADRITVSIVSHGQGALVIDLLRDLERFCQADIEVILTLNFPEDLAFGADAFAFPVQVIRNPRPQGFGANHNAAFRQVNTGSFCVLNPDIRLPGNPFPALRAALRNPEIGVVAPLIRNPAGTMEDSARKYPTPLGILLKALGQAHAPDYEIGDTPLPVDWLAGMFLMLRSETFRLSAGFDESYFLYYEDVDLCWRLRGKGLFAMQVPAVTAVHDARRQSHRNVRYLTWHIRSMLRFFGKRLFARPVR